MLNRSKTGPLVLGGILGAVALLYPQCAFTQSSSTPTFEVASVKPQRWTGNGGVGVFVHGDTLDAEHVSIFDLVMFAYDLREVQISGGPSWIRSGLLSTSELYQVMAKASAGEAPPPMQVFQQMLQALLADRFKLQVHHVQKELPIYNLVVNKGGPKLKENHSDAKSYFRSSSYGRFSIRIVATHMTMQQLIDQQLGGATDRPVFDKTGLTAAYDFTLEFIVENLPPGQEAGFNEAPALVTAVQEQLGLKLEPARASFDTIIIDHVERPTEN
ncbi:MAG TPA: TIGR03435 family protein [Bryobacteraceae bacterium]|nr:TIGR03435 family protein [Bryobacteraceae bacterium]